MISPLISAGRDCHYVLLMMITSVYRVLRLTLYKFVDTDGPLDQMWHSPFKKLLIVQLYEKDEIIRLR